MKNQNADELLESIFYYMNQLFEKRDFTSTIEILTNLGRTLVQSDRASGFGIENHISTGPWQQLVMNGSLYRKIPELSV